MSDCSSDCCCSNDCCPEVVPVTINEITNIIDEGALDLTVANVSATTKTLTIQVQDDDGVDIAGNFKIDLWFVDTNAKDAPESVIAPDTPGVARMELVTDSTGEYILTITNAALKTWYACVSLGAGIELSDAITVGV